MRAVKLFCTIARRRVRTVSGAAGPKTVYPDGGSARDSCNCMSRRESDASEIAGSSSPVKRGASMMERAGDQSSEMRFSACTISESRGTRRCERLMRYLYESESCVGRVRHAQIADGRSEKDVFSES